MRKILHLFVIVILLVFASSAPAGLYYSGEQIADLPSQWRGFLLDQKMLRNLANRPRQGNAVNPARKQYEEAAARLEKVAGTRKLTADELADLGAIQIRLGDVGRAIELLRTGQRDHPKNFQIAANLGTAWQLQGNLEAAAACLEQAAQLAPEKCRPAEELHLKLVRLRQRQGANPQGLDDLFGIRYISAQEEYEAGKLADAERRKLPGDAVALVQQLALWLPADGRLLWQLAELANAHGDVRTAANIMDGCVAEFGLTAPELREHRKAVRAAADELAKSKPATDKAKADHEAHVTGAKPRSQRPLISKLDTTSLPAINPEGINALPWVVLGETSIDPKFKPDFPKYLREMDGKQVSLTGFIQPLGDDLDLTAFLLIEHPVGCWYCETPGMTGIIRIELPADKTTTWTRSSVKVTGKLHLNASDPESFLFSICDAKVVEME